jgi:hypothetical protein
MKYNGIIEEIKEGEGGLQISKLWQLIQFYKLL